MKRSFKQALPGVFVVVIVAFMLVLISPLKKNSNNLINLEDLNDPLASGEENVITDLIVDGYALTPGFSSNVYEYCIKVSDTVSEITVEAETDSKSDINGTGKYKISDGLNLIELSVGNTVYSLYVIRNVETLETTLYSNADNTVRIGSAVTSDYSFYAYSKAYSDKTSKYYLSGVDEGTTAADLVSALNITSDYTVKVTDASGNEIEGVVATGNRLSFYEGDALVSYFEILIFGDINGDGAIDNLDLTILVENLEADEITLEGAYELALDIDRQGDGLSYKDAKLLQAHISGYDIIEQ